MIVGLQMAGTASFAIRSQRSLLSGADGALARRDFSLQTNQPVGKATWNRPHWMVTCFLIGLTIPWIIPLGPLNLSVYRLVLLAALLPCLLSWVRGELGFKLQDVALFLYSIWAAVALFAAHDSSAATQTSGIFFIETMGAYLLARRYIRNAADFRGMIFVVTMVVLALSPFAIYEWITGHKPILSTLRMIFPTVDVTMMTPRWGFWRVQGPFSHSIEFGLFCTSILALTHLAWGHGCNSASRWLLTAGVAGTAFLSMSSAPISCLFLQVVLMAYTAILWRNNSKWMILWSIILVGFLAAQLGSNQGAVKFFISHFTFDPQTGWYRVAIWDFGSESVVNHPWLGIGLADWQRPRWMPSDSVDNFWLLTAMRYGIPALVPLMGSFILTIVAVTCAKSADRTVEICRVAYVICMVTFLFVGTTVHFAHAIYSWFIFAWGSGVWLMDTELPKLARTAESNLPTRDRLLPRGNARQQSRAWN
ncbi:O-antigen ligase family protein [Bradyrhizobium sp. Ai1a-2]|uniref:O-antigen ligase family protein n=1 Tax=Bradyrhizobium sp. Ai1a-2 TaxID=196490 RepID=UPI00041313CF|nr:O-antigen ligase family protein [Bradyrhizobium sp. Ai1a-2]